MLDDKILEVRERLYLYSNATDDPGSLFFVSTRTEVSVLATHASLSLTVSFCCRSCRSTYFCY